MKISSINNVQNNNTAFDRRMVRPVEKKIERPMNMEDKMVMSMKCLGILGVAAATNVILKEQGFDAFKMAKNCVKSITKGKPQIQRTPGAN